MWFIAIGSEFSGQPGYWLTFFNFFPGTSKNSHELEEGYQKKHWGSEKAILREYFEVPGQKSKKVSQ